MLQIGQLILHYRIHRKLGEGGMGEVYLAEDTKLRRFVAIKILSNKIIENEIARKRFLQEARSASALNHPNLVTIYAIEDSENLRFIVMEYVEGETLKERLLNKPFSFKQLLNLGIQIADAVGSAHSIGIIHRDLKPANVLITPREQAKVLDFGISKMVSTAPDLVEGPESHMTLTVAPENLDSVLPSRLTQTGMVVGTIPYMSPEQTRGEPLDARTDVFSLGCLMYEALTGTPPFQGHTAENLIQNIRIAKPKPPSSYSAEIPKEFDQIIQRALAKERHSRFTTAIELADALRKLQSDTSASKSIAKAHQQKNIVAVLDFTNISGDPSIDWLSSGIAETVTVDLKKVAKLKVYGREKILKAIGSLAPKNFTDENIQNLGENLGLDWIIWGGFQKMGNALRITAKFTDVANGELLGSAKIDGTMDEIFELQDRIVTDLLDVLKIQISTSEIQKIKKPETTLLEAYEYYVRGRELFNRFGKTSFEEAQKFYEKALEIDPSYALAYSGLGSIYIFKFIAHTDSRDLDIGISHLQKAQQLDADLHEPHSWLTYAYMRRYEFEKSIDAGKLATKLDPENGMAHYFLATSYTVQAGMKNKVDAYKDAIRSYRKCIAVMPQYEAAYLIAGWIYMIHGHYQEAAEFFSQANVIEEMPHVEGIRFVGAKTLLGNLDLRQGKLDSALKHYENALKSLRESDHMYRDVNMVLTYCGIGTILFSKEKYSEAAAQYLKGCELISHNPKALAAGYFLLRSKLGLAMARKDAFLFDEACSLFEQKDGYDFNWATEATDAQIHYEIAAYYALTGQKDSALTSLAKAVESGWGDPLFMNVDSRLDLIKSEKDFQEILSRSEKLSQIIHDITLESSTE
jgi:TolB-like protein/tRNA A-37 threonylcarbamoyl transferase component Bud32/Tfp pilus assembly protein PilF